MLLVVLLLEVLAVACSCSGRHAAAFAVAVADAAAAAAAAVAGTRVGGLNMPVFFLDRLLLEPPEALLFAEATEEVEAEAEAEEAPPDAKRRACWMEAAAALGLK